MKHTSALKLRREAEAQIERKALSLVQPHPGENLLHELMHELRVYQIQLEMQTDALRQSQIELEKSSDRYVDFHDFAFVGNLTLNRDAMIENINLPGAELLGVERSNLVHRHFSSFIAPADQDHWHRHFVSVLNNDCKRNCVLTILKGDGTTANVMLVCQRLKKPDEEIVVRIVLTDIGERNQAETAQPGPRNNPEPGKSEPNEPEPETGFSQV